MSRIRDEIGRANQRFMETFGRGDAKGMAELYTSTGQLLPTGSGTVTGHEAIAGFWGGAMEAGASSAQLTSTEVEDHGDTAIEVGSYALRGADRTVMDEGKYVVVWKKEGGEWKLHRDIWNTSLAS